MKADEPCFLQDLYPFRFPKIPKYLVKGDAQLNQVYTTLSMLT